MTEVLRYNYRLRPGATATAALIAEWHRTRYLWNAAVADMRDGKCVSFVALGRGLTAKRAELDWLREGSQVAQQQELRSFAQAREQAMKIRGRGRPRFKSARKTHPSLQYTTRGFAIRDGRLVLPKGVTIPVVWSRELPSEPRSVDVFRDSLGHWYASFVVRREAVSLPPADNALGIDWGVSTTATTTNPAYDLPHTGNRRKVAAQMAAAQRRMARRKPQPGQPASNGYRAAKLEAARLAKKAQRRNRHTAREWARRVVIDHQLIAVEDFKPKFLTNSTMARKAADAAVGATKRTLIEYAQRAGRTVVMVPPAYTTMTCSSCFARATQPLGLAQRIFLCEFCHHTEDRDRNAARVILAMAERVHASVDEVRPSNDFLRAVVQGTLSLVASP